MIEDAEDLDIAMPMYNILEYSKNYRKTTGSLFNYYRDEQNSGAEGNINYSIKDSESFNCKTSIIGKLEGNGAEKNDIDIAVPLKYLGNFWRNLYMPLINCEISLTFPWFENCALTSKATRETNPNANPVIIGVNNPRNAVFEITDCKLYVPVVTLSAEIDNKLLDH